MEVTYTVYFTDGSSGVITCEKPAGAHPDSSLALIAGISKAEESCKTVLRIGRSQFFSGVILDDKLQTRDEIFDAYRMALGNPKGRNMPKKSCANCGKEIDMDKKESFKTCMNNDMHRYVCNSQCMHALYDNKTTLARNGAETARDGIN